MCDKPWIYRQHPQLREACAAALNRGEPVKLKSSLYGHLYAEMSLNFEVCRDTGTRGPYRCTSTGYALGVSDKDVRELFSFHWHPAGRSPVTKPHFHVGHAYIAQDSRLHVPTPRISVEEFVLLLVDSLNVEITDESGAWRELLAASQQLHEAHRTWSEYRESPTLHIGP